jgi:phage baseplate assembly protein W
MRYKGIAYPLVKHPQGYFHNAANDVAQIKSNLAAIILTEPNDRIFIPFFGVGLRKVNFNAPIEIVRSEIKVKIAVAIKKWEQRIQVEDIVVDLARNEENKFIIKVTVLFIDPLNVNNIESLVVYKSLGGIDGRNMPF